MTNRTANSVKYGPWLVALGAALWGTESAWRIPLNNLFDAEVIVFWEHVLILADVSTPSSDATSRDPQDRRPHLGLSGLLRVRGLGRGDDFLHPRAQARESDGRECHSQHPTGDFDHWRLFALQRSARVALLPLRRIAILAGVFLSVDHPERIGTSFEQAGLNRGTGFALLCALFWGLSTVAGRGVMTGMSLRLASSLRIVVGLFCMTLILLFVGKLHGASLWPAAAQANPGTAIGALLLLATVSGGIPLLFYFAGLRLTRASTAGYFEMMQTLAAVCITWGFFHAALRPHQVVAALVLMGAVTMVQRVQGKLE